jgi:hypothetical protein
MKNESIASYRDHLPYRLQLGRLALTLLVTRIGTHNEHHAATADDFAVLTNALDARADFHGSFNDLLSIGAKRMSITLGRQLRQAPCRIFSAKNWPTGGASRFFSETKAPAAWISTSY